MVQPIFLSPGIAFSVPVFTVADISGSTAQNDSITFKDKYFTETGPFLFIPVEPSLGYQLEFKDCSLHRFEAFYLVRADGSIQQTDLKHLESFFGLRTLLLKILS